MKSDNTPPETQKTEALPDQNSPVMRTAKRIAIESGYDIASLDEHVDYGSLLRMVNSVADAGLKKQKTKLDELLVIAKALTAPNATAPVDQYRQLFEAAMNTAHTAMEYVQQNRDKFSAKAGDDKLEIICREFLRAQVQSTPAELHPKDCSAEAAEWAAESKLPHEEAMAVIASRRHNHNKTDGTPVAVEPVDDDWHLRGYAYASKQATTCAGCGKHKHTPLRIDAMGGYVCLTCIDQKLGSLLGEFGYPPAAPGIDFAEAHQLAFEIGGDDEGGYQFTPEGLEQFVTRLIAASPKGGSDAPMQAVITDDRGVLRFKANTLVRALLDHGKETGLGLNELAQQEHCAEDRMQLAQLIGYSLSGYGTLSYVTDASYEQATAARPQEE